MALSNALSLATALICLVTLVPAGKSAQILWEPQWKHLGSPSVSQGSAASNKNIGINKVSAIDSATFRLGLRGDGDVGGREHQSPTTITSSLQPQMTTREIALLKEYIKGARTYFEFGCGGSTALAVSLGAGCIFSVDTSEVWIATVSRTVGRHACMHMQHIPLGPLGDWGMPSTTEKKHLWPLYSAYVGFVTEPLDVVLVDGRFRVACALQAWLAATKFTVVIIHDFRDRPQYQAVLKYFDVVATADTLFVLRANSAMKDSPDARLRVQHEIESYQYIPA